MTLQLYELLIQIYGYIQEHWQAILNYIDVALLLSGSFLIGAHLYDRYRDSFIGAAIIVSWVLQSHDILIGSVNSSPANTLTDLVFWLLIVGCRGNIMSVLVMQNITGYFKSIWRLVKLPFTFTVKK
ncbi:TPA: hypothetical protein U2I51_003348 [Providencia rettgeri]|nr:hypothetical protein [Providencia rettgeri]